MILFRRSSLWLIALSLLAASLVSPAVGAGEAPRRYIVQLATQTADVTATANELASKYEGTVLAVWRHALRGFWIETSPANAERLARDVRVERVALDTEVESSAAAVQPLTPPSLPAPMTALPCGDAPDANPLWHLTRISHRGTVASGGPCTLLPGLGETQADLETYRYSNDGSWGTGPGDRVIVFHVDSGVFASHVEFNDYLPGGFRASILDGFTATTQPYSDRVVQPEPAAVDTNPAKYPCSTGYHNETNAAHGTGTAAFVVGKHIGVAKGAALYPVKTMTCVNGHVKQTVAMLISGLDDVYREVSKTPYRPAVVTMSTFRSVPPSGGCQNPSSCAAGQDLTIFEEVIDRIVDKGVPFFVSANNASTDACFSTPARLSMRGGRRVENVNGTALPIGVISVGATARNDDRWPGSNYGQCVDLFAPGADLMIAYPPISPANTHPYAARADIRSGTSYSAPIVAGIAARMMAEDQSIWQGKTGGEIVREVASRLQVNATPLKSVGIAGASPRSLAYLGGVTFLEQPQSASVPPDTTHELKVKVHNPDPNGEPLTYRWFRVNGDVAVQVGTSATLAVPGAPAPGNKYFVRVSRVVDDVTHNADSIIATVTTGTCPVPVITEQPRSIWTASAPLVELKATVKTDSVIDYRWEEVTEAGSTTVPNASGSAGPGTVEIKSGLNLPAPPVNEGWATNIPRGSTPRFYRLVLAVPAGCSGWTVVESDTAQVRRCTHAPEKPILSGPANGQLDGWVKDARLVVLPGDLHTRWYFSETADGPYEPYELGDLSDEEIARNDGGTWSILKGPIGYPVKAGWYKVRNLGACGSDASLKESELSDARQVTGSCTFKLVGNYNANERFPENATPRLAVTADWPADTLVQDLEYHWKWTVGTGETEQHYESHDPTIVALPVTGYQEYDVTVTSGTGKPGRLSCTRTFKFKLDKRDSCPNPGFLVTAGQCQMNVAPVVRPFHLSKIRLRAAVETPAKDDKYTWKTIIRGAEVVVPVTGAVYDYTVNELTPHLVRVQVHRDSCVVTRDITILPKLPSCTLCTTSCKGRAVRHNGVASTFHQFAPDEVATLGAPEELTGYTYEWHQSVSGGSDAVIGTTGTITVPLQDARYYVITNTGAEKEVSEDFVAVADASTADEVEVTPAVQSVQAGQTFTITAGLANESEEGATFEWFNSATYGDWHPVVHTGKTLIRTALDDAVYWCRVRKGGNVRNSGFASVIVSCTDFVGGSVTANPVNVARDQNPRLVAHGIGKNLSYAWYRTLPDNPARVHVGIDWPVIDPVVTEPVTYFGADVVDSCGRSGTIEPVAVYLCVPTVTQPPVSVLTTADNRTPLTIDATAATTDQTYDVAWYRTSDVYATTPLNATKSFTPDVPAGSTESFYAAISSSCGPSTNVLKSAPVTYEVCAKPGVPDTPSTVWTQPNVMVTLTADATGSNLTYQWYAGQSGDTSHPILNETTSFIRPAPSTTTSYWVRVRSRGLCVSDGPTRTVKVCSPVTITQQPASVRLFTNKTTELAVTVDPGMNTEPVTYQWQQLGSGAVWTSVPGATARTFVTPPYSGPATYRVQISTGTCSVSSDEVTLSECWYPEVVPGGDRPVTYNGSTTLTLPTLSPVLEKQITWYRGEVGDRAAAVKFGEGSDLPYTTPATTQTTLYWAEFNENGCVSRTEAFRVLVCKPEVTTNPGPKTIPSGTSTTLSIGTTPISGQTYQWYIGSAGTTGNPVTNGTGASLEVSPFATTTYWCRVTTTCGLKADSTAATVTVCNPPTINSITPPATIESGTQYTLFLDATGPVLTYQWYRGARGVTTDPVTVSGTSSALSINPTTATTYWCRVTSLGVCQVDSNATTITVCANPAITGEPLSKTIFSGASTTLSVSASAGGATLSYQWYTGTRGDTSFPITTSGTGASVTVTPTAATSYWVRVKNAACKTDSQAATVTFCNYPAVVAGGEQKIAYNTSATLNLPALTPVLAKTITWYRGTVGVRSAPQASGTGTDLPLNTGVLTQTTLYWAEFTEGGCVTRTEQYTVTVCKPTVTSSPGNRTIPANTTTTLTVVTTPIAGQTYRWYIGPVGTTSNPVLNGTGASVDVAPAATTTYWCQVSSCGHAANSAAVTVTTCTAPQFTNWSPTRYVESGQSTSLNVLVYGTAPLTYQWYRGDAGDMSNPIQNATSDTLPIPGLTATTSYWCRVVSQGTCPNNSPTMKVDVCTKPAITAQPISKAIWSGATTSLNVAASSGGTLSYQWYTSPRGDTSAPVAANGTAATLTIAPPATTTYWCRVSTSVCHDDSAAATVSICAYPETVAAAAPDTKIYSGESTSLSLPVMSPAENKQITWYRGAVGVKTTPMTSGTGVNLTLHTGALTADTQYWAEFTHNGCTSRTGAYVVRVCKPAITAHPQPVTIQSGGDAPLSVTTTGSPLTYQWYRGNKGDTSQPQNGETGPSFTARGLTATATFWVRVSGCGVNADSNAATVTVCTTPAVTIAQTGSSSTTGGAGQLTATAGGTNLTYQWYKGQSGDVSRPISGATLNPYNFSLDVTEFYWVRARSGCNGMTADSAALRYSVKPTIDTQPQSLNVPYGGRGTFTVAANGTYLTYQWYKQSTNAPIPGATGASYTTPVMNTGDTFWCMVSSGSAPVYTAPASATMCGGPYVVNFSKTYGSGTTYEFLVHVWVDDQPNVGYHWYRGVPGDTAQSTYLGEGNYRMPFYNVTGTATFWCRVKYYDGGCYTDTPGITVP
jgi:Ig-like domain CHU_C associated